MAWWIKLESFSNWPMWKTLLGMVLNPESTEMHSGWLSVSDAALKGRAVPDAKWIRWATVPILAKPCCLIVSWSGLVLLTFINGPLEDLFDYCLYFFFCMFFYSAWLSFIISQTASIASAWFRRIWWSQSAFFMVNSSCFNVKALTVKLCLVYFHLLTITAPEHSHCVQPHPHHHPIFPSLYSFDVCYQ